MENEFLEFTETKSISGLTKVIYIKSKRGDKLGKISWSGPWRKYCFYPECDTQFDSSCIMAIVNVIDNLMKDRNAIKTLP